MTGSATPGSLVRRAAATLALAAFATCVPESRADAIVFSGTPDLALTSAMVAAGGGADHFSSVKLFAVITGEQRTAEAKKLTEQFGAADVANTFAVLDFAVNDVIDIVREKHIALPAPSPDPADAKALGVALYRAGLTSGGTWDVGYMLEHLITHPIHHVIMHDIDAKFGSEHNGSFHIVLAQMMHDVSIADR